jgi:hypothetical protein
MQSFQNSGTSLYLRNKILVIVNNTQTDEPKFIIVTRMSRQFGEKR